MESISVLFFYVAASHQSRVPDRQAGRQIEPPPTNHPHRQRFLIPTTIPNHPPTLTPTDMYIKIHTQVTVSYDNRHLSLSHRQTDRQTDDTHR